MIRSTFTKLAFFSLVGVFASQASAHTGVRDQADEGKASYNGFTIGHGCNAAKEGDPYEEQYPVLGQSAVFPMGDNVVWRKSGKKIIGGNGNGIITDPTLKLSVAGYASFGSAFRVSEEIVDKLGNVHALHWKKGAMEPKLNTVTPFKITAPTIADNCVKSLKVRIGVINWCDVQKNAGNDAQGPYLQPKDAFGETVPRVTGFDNGGIQRNASGAKVYTELAAGNGDNNRADWWFGDLEGGSVLYSDPDLLQHGTPAVPATKTSPAIPASPAFWTTLTINNNPAEVAKCKGKAPIEVTVEPMGVDFDTYLTGENTQPFTTGKNNF